MFKCQMRRPGKMVGIAFAVCLFGLAFNAGASDLSYWIKSISHDADTATNYTHDAVKIVSSGQYVHVIWPGMQSQYGTGNPGVLFYRRSRDNGLTFDQPQIIASAPGQFAIASDARWNNLAADSSYIYTFCTVWITGSYSMVFHGSTDNGATFSDSAVLDNVPTSSSYNGIYAAASGAHVTVGWAASQNGVGNNGAQDLLCAYSSNGGATWATVSIAHSDNTTRARIDSMNVLGYYVYDMARSGDIVYLLASISADNGSSLAVLYPSYLMLFTSTDNGATWKIPIRVNSPATDKQYYSTTYQDAHYSSKLAASGGAVHVVFNNVDDPSSGYGYSLRVRTSRDTGKTLDSTVLQTFTPSYQSGMHPGFETIVRSGANVYIATSLVNAAVGTYAWRSTDGGTTWGQPLSLSAGGWWPLIKADPSNASRLLVVNGNYYESKDGGVSFSGGITPHLNINDWDEPQFTVGSDGTAHYAGSSEVGATNTTRGIYYRRLAPAPAPIQTNKALTMSGIDSLSRHDNIQVAAGPSINFSTAMTIAFWVNFTAGSTYYNPLDPLLTKTRTAYSHGSFEIGASSGGTADQIYARLVTSQTDPSYGVYLNTGILMPQNAWTHITVTYDSAVDTNNFRIYVNGLLGAQTTVHGTILSDNRDAPLIIGPNLGQGELSDGSMMIDQLQLWNTARSQGDIITSMAGLTGTPAGLTAFYSFDSTFKDITGNGNDAVPMYKESFVGPGAKPPYILSLSPACGASGWLPTDTSLSMTFNTTMAKRTGTITISDVGSYLTTFDKLDVSGSAVSVSGATVVLRPSKPFIANHTYCVMLADTCLSSSSGGLAFPGIWSPASWNFSTGVVGVVKPTLKPSTGFCRMIMHQGNPVVELLSTSTVTVTLRIFSVAGKIACSSGPVTFAKGFHKFGPLVTLPEGAYLYSLTQASNGEESEMRGRLFTVR
ncbi:MAG: LamG-like jellyroll fold domain-containing protein [Chitinivibrionales bacterium]